MSIIDEIKELLIEIGIKESEATKALRLFCRRHGGQIIYFPSRITSKKAKEIFELLKLENSELVSERIIRVMVDNFGGIAEYVPQEKTHFRDEIAYEIYTLYTTAFAEHKKNKIDDICVTYGMSYAQVFKLMKIYKNKNANKKNTHQKNNKPKSGDGTLPLF